MKNKFRKLIAVVLTSMIAATALPTVALAAENPTSAVVYMKSKEGTSNVSFDVAGKVDAKSVKSSASWLKPYSINQYSNRTDYLDGKEPDKYNDYSLTLQASKTGTATVKYKAGSKNATTKVKVLAYTNPVSSVTCPAFNNGKNFASKTKTRSYARGIKVTASKSNQFVTIKAAKGWKIEYVWVDNDTTNTYRMWQCYSNPASSVKVYAGNIKAGERYSIQVNLKNSSTGGKLYANYYNIE